MTADPSLLELLPSDEPAPLELEELKDPGLFPRVQFFVSNFLTGYLRYAPGRINALVSAYTIAKSASMHRAAMNDLPHARAVFLDSGAFTPLVGCAKGTTTRDDLLGWAVNGPAVVTGLARSLSEVGVASGVVAALDLPSYQPLLNAAQLSVQDAEAISVRNAELLLAADIPAGWRRVFTSQGVSLDDHMRCLDRYEKLGILDAVATGDAWLAVGGMAFETASNHQRDTGNHRVATVHREIRKRVPVGHIHSLGVTRVGILAPMVDAGWVNSADSSSPAREIQYNRGPYRVTGPRPSFVWESLHAASALYYEAQLAQELARLAKRAPVEVLELPWYEQMAGGSL